MKKLFFLVSIAIMLISVSCSKDSDSNPDGPEKYVGTYYAASKGSVDYQTDSNTTKQIPILLFDTINISVDPANSNALICKGKIFKGNAVVTDQGFKFDDITYEYTGEGIGYTYKLSLNITNDYASFLLGLLSWNSTITGEISGGTIGVGVEKGVTGSLTTTCVKKIW